MGFNSAFKGLKCYINRQTQPYSTNIMVCIQHVSAVYISGKHWYLCRSV